MSRKTKADRDLETEIIRAHNDGRQLLAWEKIEDQVKPLVDQIGAIIDTLPKDERGDAECHLTTFLTDWYTRRIYERYGE